MIVLVVYFSFMSGVSDKFVYNCNILVVIKYKIHP